MLPDYPLEKLWWLLFLQTTYLYMKAGPSLTRKLFSSTAHSALGRQGWEEAEPRSTEQGWLMQGSCFAPDPLLHLTRQLLLGPIRCSSLPAHSTAGPRDTRKTGPDIALENSDRDFPGDPVVKTPVLPVQGAWIWSLVGEQRFCMPQGVAPPKKLWQMERGFLFPYFFVHPTSSPLNNHPQVLFPS